MIIKTERLILRPWKEDDAESLYKYAKDPAVAPIAGWPVHTSVEDSLDIINNVLSVEETYAVCLKEDNQAIGSVGLIPPMQSHTEAAEDEIEVGYWIGVPFWGQGYIPEAVRAIQQHVFEDLGCSAMWCGYYDGNVKSKRCQEKCGFRYHHTEENKPCELMGDVRTEHFTKITKGQWETMTKTVVLYVHGKGGNAGEASYYKKFFQGCEVVGLDYKYNTPWETKKEIQEMVAELKKKYETILLVANSVGAYFSMNAEIESAIAKAYFVSPIVDMETLIGDMMMWAGVSLEELQARQTIDTDFGEQLSWRYLTYVKENPIGWNVPTKILYGSKDNLTSRETIQRFAEEHKAELTVMEGGEHWFHTEEQMAFLDQWMYNGVRN